MKQKFIVIIHSHGEKPVTPIDLALCLKHLPLNTSKASFQIKEEKQDCGK
jgi:hypothetical protein